MGPLLKPVLGGSSSRPVPEDRLPAASRQGVTPQTPSGHFGHELNPGRIPLETVGGVCIKIKGGVMQVPAELQSPGHRIRLQAVGGACAYCVVEGATMSCWDCECGLASACRVCMVEHLREERKEIAKAHWSARAHHGQLTRQRRKLFKFIETQGLLESAARKKG